MVKHFPSLKSKYFTARIGTRTYTSRGEIENRNQAVDCLWTAVDGCVGCGSETERPQDKLITPVFRRSWWSTEQRRLAEQLMRNPHPRFSLGIMCGMLQFAWPTSEEEDDALRFPRHLPHADRDPDRQTASPTGAYHTCWYTPVSCVLI